MSQHGSSPSTHLRIEAVGASPALWPSWLLRSTHSHLNHVTLILYCPSSLFNSKKYWEVATLSVRTDGWRVHDLVPASRNRMNRTVSQMNPSRNLGTHSSTLLMNAFVELSFLSSLPAFLSLHCRYSTCSKSSSHGVLAQLTSLLTQQSEFGSI